MKSRSREVNIFNMSLLDILCGALGAFCFLMLVLFPSYENKVKAGGNDTAALEEELRRMQAELQRAREAAAKGQPGDVQQLTQQLKQTENSWRQAEARARDAESKLKQAQNEAAELSGKVQVRQRPMIVEAIWSNPADEVNVYVRYTGKSADGKMAPPFDPNVRPQAAYAGDNWFAWAGHEMWLIRDAPAGEYEVYYRLAKQADARQPVLVRGLYATEGTIAWLPQASLEAGRKGILLATLVRTAEAKITVKPAGGQR